MYPSPTHLALITKHHKAKPLQDVIITTYETLMSTEERMGHWILLADGVPVFHLQVGIVQILSPRCGVNGGKFLRMI